MAVNTAKRRMLEGQPAIGAEAGLGSTLSVELMAPLGFDFILVDTQHGAWVEETAMQAFRAIRLGGCPPMARVRSNDFGLIGRLLDIGAMGIIAPMVNSVQDAEAFAFATHYPPRGGRSFGPFGTGFLGSDYDNWIDQELFVGVQIETAEGAENAEEIMTVDGIDGCWVGPNDLSRSMDVELGSPAHVDAIRGVIKACQKTGKVPGISTPTAEAALRWIEEGCLFVTAGGDPGWVLDGAQETLRKLGRAP